MQGDTAALRYPERLSPGIIMDIRALPVGQAQIATGQQVFMHAYRAFIFAAAAKQVPQREVQLGRVRVVLYGFNERINGLVLLLIEQEIQAFEISFGGLLVFNAQLAQIQA